MLINKVIVGDRSRSDHYTLFNFLIS